MMKQAAALLMAMMLVAVRAQVCTPDTAILTMTNSGKCSTLAAVADCFAKLNFTVTSSCAATLTPVPTADRTGVPCFKMSGMVDPALRTLSAAFLLGGKGESFPVTMTNVAPGQVFMRLGKLWEKDDKDKSNSKRSGAVDCVVQFGVAANLATFGGSIDGYLNKKEKHENEQSQWQADKQKPDKVPTTPANQLPGGPDPKFEDSKGQN